jgi:vacuolar-type H+-ATPase subunit H
MAMARKGWTVHAPRRADLDLFDRPAVEDYLARTGADTLFNTVAYTRVDQAEDEPAEAARLNRQLPLILGQAARNAGVQLIHYSTDFVFNGRKATPYTTEDQPDPRSVYGSTKLQGERELAQYNKTLGRFQLAGIAPAPRGVPQIEVTFDIDANGIVHVSAKDLGTGHEQKVTITASTNLTEDEIKHAVNEAERFAGEDKKRKEEVETRNHADQLVYTTEKTMKELGDKISSDDKHRIESALSDLRKTLEGNDTAMIKTASDKLTEVSYEVFGKIYQQSAQQQGPQGGPGPQQPHDDTVVDADYEVVDDDKK